MMSVSSYSFRALLLGSAVLIPSIAFADDPVTGKPAQTAQKEAAQKETTQKETAADDDATALPAMDVTGSRAPEHYRLEEVTPQVKLTREVYEQLPTGLRANDVVQRMPGVYTGGGPGENKDLRLRGLDKEYSRVTLDGVSIPDGGEKRELNLDRLPNFLVDEITLIRNPTADMEMDGIAGRLNIKTREIPLERTIEIQTGSGDTGGFGTGTHQFAVAYGERINDRFGIQSSLSYSKEAIGKEKRTLNANGVTTKTEREDKPTTYIDAFVDAGWFYDGGEIHLKPMYQYQEEDKEKFTQNYNTAGVRTTSVSEAENKPKETIGVSLTNKHTFADGGQIEGKIGFYTTHEWKDKPSATRNAAGTVTARSTEKEDKTDQIWNGDLSYSHPFETGDWEHTAKAGVALRYREREKTKATTNNLTGVTTRASKDQYQLNEFYRAAFVMNEIVPTNRLTLSPGVRFESVALDSTDADGPSKSSTFNDILPSLPVNYRLTDKLALKGAVSRVVNRPKFDEITPYETFSGTTLTIGNPDLTPEKAWAFDAGFDYVDEKLFLGFNAFYRMIENHLETRATGETRLVNGTNYTVQQMQNVGDGTLRGLELEQRVDLDLIGGAWLKPFRLTTNETFIDSKVKNNAGVETPFAQQPDFIANAILDWNLKQTGTKLSLAGNYVGPIKRKKYAMDSFDEEVFWDFKVTQEVYPGVETFVLFENFTDEDRRKEKSDGTKEIESGGRSFFLGLTAKL